MIDTWIQCLPAVFSAVQSQDPAPKLAAQAQTGYWGTFTGGFEVYNVVGTSAEVVELTDALEAHTEGSVNKVFSWVFQNGADNIGENETIPADILSVMKDHKTYDANGNETSSTPPTFTTPNWGHTFFGQLDRIFAGEFNTDFSEDFH